MAKPSRGTARVARERPLGVQEASGVAHLGGDQFLVIDDEHGVFRCSPDSDPVPLDAARGFADLEGICVDEGGRHAYVLAERDGSVWRFGLADGDLTEGKRLGKLPRLNKKKNQGWEGIAFARAGTLSERAELVAVHQVGPRRVGFFDAETLHERATLALPKDARRALGDLNDVTLHPTHPHLFVVSGKAGRLAELAVRGDALELVRLYPLETAQYDVPEGVTFGTDGRLFVVTDGEGMLRELELNG